MSRASSVVPAEALELARQGNLVEAIKLTREKRGLSLKDAKVAVESALHGGNSVGVISSALSGLAVGDMPPEAIAALRAGQLIDAIKSVRESSGMGLKDSKLYVERYLEENLDLKSEFKAAASSDWPRLVAILVMAVSLAGLAAIAYQYLR